MSFTEDLFYTYLPLNQKRVSEIIPQDHLFFRLPNTWSILLVTIFKDDGRENNLSHRGLLETDFIVCVLNVFYETAIKVPYFFTDFGACFLMPEEYINDCCAALSMFEKIAHDNFKLVLITKKVSLRTVYEAGHELRIAKMEASEGMVIPAALGDGLEFAYRLGGTDHVKPK